MREPTYFVLASLPFGGLRGRAGQGERIGLAASLRQVGLFAAVLTLGPYAAANLATLNDRWRGDAFPAAVHVDRCHHRAADPDSHCAARPPFDGA